MKKKYKKIMKKKYKKRLKSGVNFLSLPCDVVSDICSFCEANEILALSLTCQTLHKDVGNSMLHIDVTRSNIPKVWKIPIFFPDQCHSVFFTWKIVTPHRDHEHTLILVSRRRDNYGRSAETIVWKKTKCIACGTHQNFYFSFRNNPSQEYFLRHECSDASETYFRVGSIAKQYIVNALTPTKKDALTACLKMGCIQIHIFRSIEPRTDILPFFMKLFVVCFGSLSTVESHGPIRAFFDSACFKPIESFPGNIRYVQEQMSNIFEQVLEQKEPGHCVKLPLAHDCPSRARSTDMLPHLLLTNEFVWNPSERRNDLEFVARIPLFYNTRRFEVTVLSLSYTHRNGIFVLFFQKRQSSLEDSESPIAGKVVMGRQFWYVDPSSFDVDPKYESCFLYFFPDNSTTTMKLKKLDVKLVNTIFCNSDESVREGMELLLDGYGGSNISLRDRLVPIALFRGVALTLLGSDQGPHTALKEVLDANQIDTTPHGLQCIVDICNMMMDE